MRSRIFSARGTGATLPSGVGPPDAREDCAGDGCAIDAPIQPAASAAATINPTERELNINAIAELKLQDTQ
jgi:hypothetical protein